MVPFYLLVDESTSMAGERIEALNQSLLDLLHEMAHVPVVADRVHLSIIAFSDDAEVLLPLTDVDSVLQLPVLATKAGTNYGSAFRCLKDQIEYDVERLKQRGRAAFRPVVFFLTAGGPDTDDWVDVWMALTDKGFKYHPRIVAFGVGEADADTISQVATVKAIMPDNSTTVTEGLSELASDFLKSIVSSEEVRFEQAEEPDGGWLRYGPPAVLKPTPTTRTEQPCDLPEEVPDIAMDWLDLATGQIRAASVRGHMHRHLGEVRQDTYAFEAHSDLVTLAVADGVGNTSASHVGASLVARHVVRSIDLIERIRTVVKGLVTVSPLSGVLEHEADRRELAPQHLATTLAAAFVPTEPDSDGVFRAVLMAIGDSSAWRRTDSGWTECRPVCQALDADSTAFSESPATAAVRALPVHDEAIVWRESFVTGDTLALVSDGAADIVHQGPNEFARDLSALWRASAPTPAALLRVLDATVKSFDDDRTFVGYRFS